MEALDQNYGFILYRKELDRPAKGTLEITEARDYALVYQGDKMLGALDRRLKQNSLNVELSTAAPVDIVVENMGRVNFGPNMVPTVKASPRR
jgi:beta-galactosidase